MQRQSELIPPQLQCSERWAEDERWIVAQRVVNSGHFSRSPLLSRFLLYIVAETIEGRAEQITEHKIGVQVFDRPPDYRTVEDNIVRNYARQIRKRLADFYSSADGANESIRIEIPLGGYVPLFPRSSPMKPQAVPAAEVPDHPASPAAHQHLRRPFSGYGKSTIAAALLLYTIVIAATSWFIEAHLRHPNRTATSSLWRSILDGPLNTYIVPPDAGFNLFDDVSHHRMPLADYMNGAYNTLPLPSLGPHSAGDLRSQELTSFVSLKAVMQIGRIHGFRPGHDIVRFPRSIHLQDLQDANVILLGSEDSNPWTSIAQKTAKLRIVDWHGTRGAEVLIQHPRDGEKQHYISHWNDPEHETFALIQYLPNLGGNGHILILQGLDVAGTEAAVNTLLHPTAIASILRKARRPDGQLRPFEILLRSTSIASNAEGTQVIASRIY